MIMLLLQGLGISITPVIRFMLVGFELISVGFIVLRIMDAVRQPRLADLAAQRRERWEAVHAAPSVDTADQDDD